MQDPITSSLQSLYDESLEIKLGYRDRLVVFSDLHVGNRRRGDDFLKNSELFMAVLGRHYFPQGYTLLLNGDIEELLRFSLSEVEARWSDLYTLFGQFHDAKRFYKVVGNHDITLPLYREYSFHDALIDGLKLRYKDEVLFLFHGHQASNFQTRFNMLVGLSLRYVARPLGIKNYSVSRSTFRQYKTERRVYSFSHADRIASLIGHTHRPLFESLSKIDALRFRIEQLCRQYTTARAREKRKLSEDIQRHKTELEQIYERKGELRSPRSIYNSKLLIPCLFNSGCCIGKRGITAIELHEGEIALVHWFDKNLSQKHFDLIDETPQQLDGSDYYKVVLNQDSLDYIFTRIRMLAD
ncbi:MAG: metallophosphoesterase [Spirochaetaceae bacterium]|nr:MAG: metallophosphoesterase [Spirochaetaceae bacterium]